MSENQIINSENIKSKVLGAFGGSSSGLGTFGAIHNICHYTCQGIIALLAIFGISAVGMPLGFLLDPSLVILFSSIGLASITLSILLHIKYKKSCSRDVTNKTSAINKKHRILADKKLLAFLALGIMSIVSLISGTNDALAKQSPAMDLTGRIADILSPTLTLDSIAKTNSGGDTSLTITYSGISNEGLAFAVSMETSNMDSPSLAEYDLAMLSYLSVGNDETKIKPTRWAVQETGHMGHHLKGMLVFSVDEKIVSQTKQFKIVISDIAGVKQRIFSWKML
ncbi:MAG: hypothetical protein ACREAE_09990 [Nitrosopumilaceae archaeon]